MHASDSGCCAGKKNRKNRKCRNTEIELKSVERIRILIMNKLSLDFMQLLHLVLWIFGKIHLFGLGSRFHGYSTLKRKINKVVFLTLLWCFCRSSDAHKLSIEKSKYLGGLYCTIVCSTFFQLLSWFAVCERK